MLVVSKVDRLLDRWVYQQFDQYAINRLGRISGNQRQLPLASIDVLRLEIGMEQGMVQERYELGSHKSHRVTPSVLCPLCIVFLSSFP